MLYKLDRISIETNTNLDNQEFRSKIILQGICHSSLLTIICCFENENMERFVCRYVFYCPIYKYLKKKCYVNSYPVQLS